ncbi:PTS fructose transporter subunit IIC [Spirochaeta africana]|uniref:protein-N(pi)-phosphohistidine--D-fructose phosphotransferase n=1 Tax=Spirochaeta africana (strain ATCC 700263 / DSM 8902 / Z-7692) TaxID=889378 RepID=H9UGZ2_SPIAZ|nr:fructose-specific PTS transporter subunit EIIC [Spirochaeta africana]AFG36785.1 PTS system, fructose-specific, IIB component/PTS system, fructose subfamily, IIC component [Spirochaeta africana DSM 8902]
MKLVAITSCPTGIAHTFMAAEALEKSAKALGYKIKVETQGSVGVKNELSESDIAAADAVIIAADTGVDTARFVGKRVYQTGTKEALHNGESAVKAALDAPVLTAKDLGDEVANLKQARSQKRTGPYKHLMTGVSYMLPVVVAGGLSIALSFIFGIEAFQEEGTLAAALMEIGGGGAFALMVPVLAGFIAFSIAGRPGLAPGLVGGMLANTIEAGFLGGILAGFLAGYLVDFLNRKINLPKNLDGLKPILILPFLSTLVVGLMMMYVIGPPVSFVMVGLTSWLQGMQQTSAVFLGLILGLMMAFDMGGPVNKAAYTFAVGLLSSSVYAPMAAVMAAGMTPPLGLALAAYVFKNRFSVDERKAANAAIILGASFITEGAIPYAAKDPFRVIPSIMFGSAIAAALSMAFGSTLMAPHGGLFVLAIPNAVGGILLYLLAIIVGSVATAGALFLLKKPIYTEA